MFIADTHSDTLFAMGVMHAAHDALTITPERLHEGGVSLQTFAMWTGSKGNKGDVAGILAAEMSQVPLLAVAGLRQVDDPADVREGENCFMLSIEGGEAFEEGIHTVEMWQKKGVRMAALLWNNENELGYSAKSGDKRGLKPFGIEVAKEMQRLHMAVDVSHLNEAGFYDLFAKTDRVPMASHSCCKALCSHARNLTDEQIRLMIREKGFIGVNFYPYFLADDGKADAALVARHIDRICQMGGDKIVGFGSDFDGIECVPEGLAHPGEMGNLIAELHRLGYSDEAVAGIAGENLRAYFTRM